MDMNKTKRINHGVVNGTIDAPASKSMMQRAVAASFLSELYNPEHKVNIINPSNCDDALASLRIIESLKKTKNILDCGESGLSLRMFVPIVALLEGEYFFTGTGSLLKRPISIMEEPLKQLGIECRTSDGFLPIYVKGPLKAGKINLEASTTSQFLTGLLMALPCCSGDSEIQVKDLKSRPYVEMTLSLLKDFGIKIEHDGLSSFRIKGSQRYNSINYTVEGDWSGSSFILVAGALAGKIKMNNIDYEGSLQADKKIIDILIQSGAKVNIGTNFVEIERTENNAFEFNAEDSPDLFPPLVSLACSCKGTSVIHGLDRLTHKESNRGITLQNEFNKIGAKIKLLDNKMLIKGSVLKGGSVDSNNDHRIAMACAVAGLVSLNGVQINGAGCVSKSYPAFFEDLDSIIKKD